MFVDETAAETRLPAHVAGGNTWTEGWVRFRVRTARPHSATTVVEPKPFQNKAEVDWSRGLRRPAESLEMEVIRMSSESVGTFLETETDVPHPPPTEGERDSSVSDTHR